MGDSTLFVEVASLCERLKETTSRKEKTHLISDFLLKLEGREVAPSVLLIVGQVFPESEKKVMKVGFALRFARIARIRDDKAPEDVDSIERVRRLYNRQFLYKSKL